MVRERGEAINARVLTPESEGVVEQAMEMIASGGVVVMKIEGPMYGLLGNVAEERVVERIWGLKGRSWIGRPVKSTEGIQKPVTGVTRQRLARFVDWTLLGLSIDAPLIETLLETKTHLVLPVREGLVPSHLLTYHEEIPTLSMMPVGENNSLLGSIVSQLEKDSPGVIVGGSSANKKGLGVFTELQPLMRVLGGRVDLIIRDNDVSYDGSQTREAFQRAMALILPQEKKIQREGIGADELRLGLSLFASPLEP